MIEKEQFEDSFRKALNNSDLVSFKMQLLATRRLSGNRRKVGLLTYTSAVFEVKKVRTWAPVVFKSLLIFNFKLPILISKGHKYGILPP